MQNAEPESHLGADAVLIVDDDPLQRRLLRDALTRLGVHEIEEARDGIEALEIVMARTAPFDLMLVDLSMPRRDGVELLRDLARIAYAGRIALLSGFDARVLETARQLAATHGLHVLGSLEKPVLETSLVAVWRHQRSSGPRRRVGMLPITRDDLARAIDEGGISLAYQPKVALGDEPSVAAECLARWVHPTLGPVPPDQFIALAEDAGLIDALSRMVLRQAVEQRRTWASEGFAPRLSVNLSMDNLRDVALPDALRRIVDDGGLRPSEFVLEITETRLSQDSASTSENLVRLRLAGFELSIDDFGTGFSSLEQLRKAPFSELKIDRTFTTGAYADPTRRAILEASLQMARNLGIRSVAEGVETERDLALITALGCDVAQGYLFSRPLAAGDYRQWTLQGRRQRTTLN